MAEKDEEIKAKKTNKEEEGEERKELIFKKRAVELKQRYLNGEELLNMQNYINRHIYFYRCFEPAFEVKPGEIYYADFPVGFGAEIHGRHPVVVLNKSGAKYPMMTVVPLTSKSCNPVSDYDLGIIKGLSKDGAHSVAVINQTRSIDKRRVVVEQAIRLLKAKEKNNPINPDEEIIVTETKVCRLSADQLTKLKNKIKRFIGYNKISSHK